MRDLSRDYLYAIGRQVPRRYTLTRQAVAAVKIGRSWAPDERLIMLRHEFQGESLWMIDALPRLAAYELVVHQALAPWCVTGEWFDNSLLIAIMRWGFSDVVSWALGDGLVHVDAASFLESDKRDIEESRLSRQKGA